MEISLLHTAASQISRMQPDHGSSEVKDFERAILAKKIFDCADEEIKEALRYGMVLIGIRATTMASMTEMEKVVLISFVRKNYGRHTREEFKMAFHKAVSRELSLDDKEINPFENFTCEYIGKIMRAYRAWAADYYKESGLELKAIKNEVISLPPSKYDAANWVEECYQDFLSGTLNIEILPERVYDIAVENELLAVADEKKVWCLKFARKHVFNYYSEEVRRLNPQERLGEYNAAVAKLKKLKELKGWDIVKEPYVNRYAKAVALQEYFYELKSNNLNKPICLCLLKPSMSI